MYDMRGAAETRGYPVSLASYLRLMAGASVLLVAAALASAALGQTADLSVTAEIQATCTLDGGSLNFGNYSGSATEGQGSFSYECTGGSNITLSLGPGQNPEGAGRAMADGAERLLYELYQDAARQQEWGEDGDALSIQTTSADEETVQVYGLIPPDQDAPAGSYSDTVQITLNIQ
jgi:spore coat protein U-like protein